ncbi:alpha-amylase family glycosyl hydrolase [Henriciella mobilis]|uniref:Alpha-amylase n=1 Tax=Henriciella mobilis TaxID=2305467 RepID=A0A399RPE0_9PROT|nr:alpha-amylase family glycosyl hydrolase [Henriciella mobilis]RIJ33068.1 alpha-amylase [Henriciella mobilis]
MTRTSAYLRAGVLATLLAAAGCTSLAQAPDAKPLPPLEDRLPQDEIIYFVMPDRFENGDPSNDRGGISGDRLDHGFDPTDNGFYHGGDLKGLTSRLDYIEALGATAIWLTPIFENKPVQGPPGLESAAYHGYWITDFTNVDPHLGTREDFKAFVEAAHARGMKVYMDIITNHTADVIQYRECSETAAPGDEVGEEGCVYRSKGAYPWTTEGGPDGPVINEGFLGSDAAYQTAENFKALDNPDWAYHPFVPANEASAKTPAWLNDPIYYHNRGNSAFEGESSRFGDFAGLDDLMTEDPRVVAGFIDIYKQWITDYRVDGFRIDTAKHVNPEFWQAFVPAMEAHARSLGIHHFHVFGEVYEFDAGRLSAYTTRDRLTSVLDFALQSVLQDIVVNGAPARRLEELFEVDHSYADGLETAAILPTFLGNHDMGRFAGFLREADPDMTDEEMLARLKLAHAMLIFSRGVPTIYYGDEQGFVSDGHDRAARENMFESQVADYNDNDLVGTQATTGDVNFDTRHPLFSAIAEMAATRMAHPALRRGKQVIRHSDEEGGLFAMSRFNEDRTREYLIVFNADEEARTLNLSVSGLSAEWASLHGDCAPAASSPGSYPITVAPLDFLVCYSEQG